MMHCSRQEITDAEILDVEMVLQLDFSTRGLIVAKFGKSIADYCNTSHAIVANSAISALHII